MDIVIMVLLRVVELYSYILLAYVILSWLPPLYHTYLARLILWLVRPVLEPFRKLNLTFMGIDFTVFVAMFLLNVVTRILVRLLFWL